MGLSSLKTRGLIILAVLFSAFDCLAGSGIGIPHRFNVKSGTTVSNFHLAVDGVPFTVRKDNAQGDIFTVDPQLFSIFVNGMTTMTDSLWVKTGEVTIGNWGFNPNAQLQVKTISENEARSAVTNLNQVNPTGHSAKNYIGALNTVDAWGLGPFTLSGEYTGSFSTAIADGDPASVIMRLEGHEGEAIIQSGTVNFASGNAGRIISHGGVTNEAAALWARPALLTGGNLQTIYGLKVDPPGVGTTRWTLGVGTGESYIAGSLKVGSATSPIGSTLSVKGGSGIASGGLTALRVEGGDHANMINAENIDVNFSLNRNVQFSGGGAPIPLQRVVNIDPPTYSAILGQDMLTGVTFNIVGPPPAGPNMNILDPLALRVASGAARFNGRILGSKGTSVASAPTITLGSGGNYFHVTGNIDVDCLSTAGWTNGSEVTLGFDDVLTVHDAFAVCVAGTANFELSGDFLTTDKDILKVILDGPSWKEISRSVN